MTTLAAIRERHARAEAKIIVAALKRHGWSLRATAAELDVPPSTLRRAIDSHGLASQYHVMAPSRGRPKNT